MSQLGLGVMIGLLSGNERSIEIFSENIGKIIIDLAIVKREYSPLNELLFTFEGGSRMKLFDDGQSCCESRYMHTDDNLSDFIGASLQGGEVRAEDEIGDYGAGGARKDSAFLIISTSIGQFTIVNYNEHNGYYGGFLIRAAKG